MLKWRWPEGLLAVWCVALFAGALVTIFPGWNSVGGWLASNNAPAWIQAITSSIALGVALAVVILQHRLQAAERLAAERARIVRCFVAALGASAAIRGLMVPIRNIVDSPELWREHVLPLLDDALSELTRLDVVSLPCVRVVFDAAHARRALVSLRAASGAYAVGSLDRDGILLLLNSTEETLAALITTVVKALSAYATDDESRRLISDYASAQPHVVATGSSS